MLPPYEPRPVHGFDRLNLVVQESFAVPEGQCVTVGEDTDVAGDEFAGIQRRADGRPRRGDRDALLTEGVVDRGSGRRGGDDAGNVGPIGRAVGWVGTIRRAVGWGRLGVLGRIAGIVGRGIGLAGAVGFTARALRGETGQIRQRRQRRQATQGRYCRGGRATEFLLGCTIALQGQPGVYALAADTDGIDGVEANAGAVAAPDTLARGAALGLKAQDFLDRNDCCSYFEALDDLVVPGPTYTNVNDFRALYIRGG